jgi:hypothetical protein
MIHRDQLARWLNRAAFAVIEIAVRKRMCTVRLKVEPHLACRAVPRQRIHRVLPARSIAAVNLRPNNCGCNGFACSLGYLCDLLIAIVL